jgi:ATP-dependent DNA helicase PIF1
VEVINYMKPASIQNMEELLVLAQEKYILDIVLSHFSLYALPVGLEVITSNSEIQKANITEVKLLLIQLEKSVSELIAVSIKFQSQLKQLHLQSSFAEQQKLQDRIESALGYFIKEITLQILNPLNKNIRVKPKNKIQQQIQHMLLKYRQIVENKISILQTGALLLKNPIQKEAYIQWITEQKEKAKRKPGTSNQAQQNISLQLF